MHKNNFQLIPLKSITHSDHWSLHQDLDNSEDQGLILSVKQYGILRPPVVLEEMDNFVLLCGKKRLAAVETTTPKTDILCRVISSKSPRYLLKFILEDQKDTGPLTALMKARFLSMCIKQLPQDTVETFINEIEDLNYRQIKRLLPLLSLELPIRNAIHCGNISERTGLELLHIPREDRLFLNDLFNSFSLNKNKQKNLIEMCRIIMVRENISIKSLFNLHFNESLQPDKNENIPQLTNNLFKKLYEISHPHSSDAEKNFTKRVSQLKLPNHFSIEHSPAFEQDKVSLRLSYKNIGELEKDWRKIELLFRKS